MSGTAALEARRVSFVYREGTHALRDIDFALPEGSFTALLASNGSGKTTLIKALVGLLKPQRGDVLIGGTPVGSLSPAQLFRRVGVVMQNPNDQLFGPTVGDDIAFGVRNLGIGEPEARRRVEQALDEVGLSGLHARAIHHLSFGQQKRVCIAGALAMHPSILVLDEPTSGLDPVGEAAMLDLLHRLNRNEGMTILLATHSVDLLPLFATKIVILTQGSIAAEGRPEEIFSATDILSSAGLRLPYIGRLFEELRCRDGLPLDALPLTLGEARKRLLELIPEDRFTLSGQVSGR